MSIVTVCRNAADVLGGCIASVLRQDYGRVEHIVIDGASTDATLALLQDHDAIIDLWLSEPDEGIFAAMNKGLSLAGGDVLAILNADDRYEPDAVSRSVAALAHSGADFSCAPVRLLHDGVAIAVRHPLPRDEWRRRSLQEMPFAHVSLFLRRSTLERVGGFDLRYRVAADHDFVVRMLAAGCRGVVLPRPIGDIALGGASSAALAQRESRDIALRHGKPPLQAWGTWLIQVLRRLAREVLPVPLQRRITRLVPRRYDWL
ncbi:MAG: glycosyltransferase [Betaproteobacteria bacterium]|nr:glycosyltransferase [Betaproteobacteria bacterium]